MSTVQSSELAVMVAVALDPPACLEPKMLMVGFDFIVPDAQIIIVQVPTIAACAGRQKPASAAAASSARLFPLLFLLIAGRASDAPAFIGPSR